MQIITCAWVCVCVCLGLDFSLNCFFWRSKFFLALIAYKLALFAFLVESKTVFIEFIYLVDIFCCSCCCCWRCWYYRQLLLFF